jgi:hypothetical protein
MGVRLAPFIILAASVSMPGNAVVNHGQTARQDRCQVVGGEKLPTSAGADKICTAIAKAMAAKAPGVGYDVEVQVLSKSRLSAAVVINGRSLPRQNMAVSDGELGSAAVQRFANSIAAAAAAHI